MKRWLALLAAIPLLVPVSAQAEKPRDDYMKPVERDGLSIRILPNENVPMRSDSYECYVKLRWQRSWFLHETTYATMTFGNVETAQLFEGLLNDGRGKVRCRLVADPG